MNALIPFGGMVYHKAFGGRTNQISLPGAGDPILQDVHLMFCQFASHQFKKDI